MSGDSIEGALTDLISQLGRGDFQESAEAAGTRAVEAIASAIPCSLEPDEQQRVKRLHALALSMLGERRSEIESELERVQQARALLQRCARQSPAEGSGLNVSG